MQKKSTLLAMAENEPSKNLFVCMHIGYPEQWLRTLRLGYGLPANAKKLLNEKNNSLADG